MKIVRVYFEHCEKEWSPEDNYLIDMALNGDGLPKEKVCFFGVWGQLGAPDNLYPAVLMPDGRIDLGSAREQVSPGLRYHETNIRQRKIVVGELVTVWEPNDDNPEIKTEYTLRIKAITSMDELY